MGEKLGVGTGNTIAGISWESDPCVEGDGMGRGVGVFRLVPHGRVAANLGFNKPVGFDNQTLFCLFLGF